MASRADSLNIEHGSKRIVFAETNTGDTMAFSMPENVPVDGRSYSDPLAYGREYGHHFATKNPGQRGWYTELHGNWRSGSCKWLTEKWHEWKKSRGL